MSTRRPPPTADLARLVLERELSLPLIQRAASVVRPSLDVTARTVELVWSTGARRLTWSWEEFGIIEEELDLSGVDLSRLNNRASVLNAHCAWQLSDVLGVVVKAWVVGAPATEGRAVVRFSKRAEVEPIWQDIVDEILTNVSIGYTVKTYVVTREEGKVPLYRATEWQPFEISPVPVGADAGAGFRAATPAQKNAPPPLLYPCRLLSLKREEVPVPVTPVKESPMLENLTTEEESAARTALADYVDAAKMDDCIMALDKAWPKETASGDAAGATASLAEAGKALGIVGEATPAAITLAAKNLRALADAALDKEDENEVDLFAKNEAKGLHRKLDALGKGFARQLYDGNRALYEARIKGVKPLVGEKPPEAGKKGERTTVAALAKKDDEVYERTLARQKELMAGDPKLPEAEAYKIAFREVQKTLTPARAE